MGLLLTSDCSNGQGYEGNEGDGRHEGDEGHEEKVSERHCKGPHGQSYGLPRVQGQDREQEGFRKGQEECLDDCRAEGKEGTEDQGLRRNQEGLRALQEGQGVLLKMLVEASAQGVGMSTPLECRSFDCI